MLIGIGNVIVGTIVDKVASGASFRKKSARDLIVVVVAFFATFVNVITDLMMTAAIVKAIALDEAFQGKPKAYDRILAESLYGLVVPGYLFLPLIIAPLFGNWVPFMLNRAIVATRWVPRRTAEKALELPEFDMCWRYSDILNNFTLALVLCAFLSPYSWMVVACLLGYLLLVLLIDHFVLLRHSRMTFYTSGRLSAGFAVLWSVPTGALALLVGWWAYKAGYVGWFVAPLLLLLHFVVYGATFWYCRRQHHVILEELRAADGRYDAMYRGMLAEGKPLTYFNTNLVFCLRSCVLPPEESGWDVIRTRHVHDPSVPGCVPWIPGKQYLQPGGAKSLSHEMTMNVGDQIGEQGGYAAGQAANYGARAYAAVRGNTDDSARPPAGSAGPLAP